LSNAREISASRAIRLAAARLEKSDAGARGETFETAERSTRFNAAVTLSSPALAFPGQRPTIFAMSDVTQLLSAIDAGDANAADKLLPLVYEELRRLAASKMAHEKPGQTLQATALVHEAWLRLAGSDQQQWRGRSHFFGAAAEAMRRILIDKARQKASLKRGQEAAVEELRESQIEMTAPADEILAVHGALDALAAEDATRRRSG
jgi:RNA polymerase sigma factor (TIGR02999 family)